LYREVWLASGRIGGGFRRVRSAGIRPNTGPHSPAAVTTSRGEPLGQEASHAYLRSPSTPVLVAAGPGGRAGPGTGGLPGAGAPGGSRPVLGQPGHHLVPVRAQESAGRVGPDRGADRRPGRLAGATRSGRGGGTPAAGPPGLPGEATRAPGRASPEAPG